MEDTILLDKPTELEHLETKSSDIANNLNGAHLLSSEANVNENFTSVSYNLSAVHVNDSFELNIPPIEESFDSKIIKKSIAEQYFEFRFYSDDSEDFCLLFHSNRICVVTLAKSHSIIQYKKEIKNIEFKKEPGMKKNSLLQPQTVVCLIYCSDGSFYKVRASIPGKLIEINKNLIHSPSLLLQEPTEDGYLFILLPTKSNYEVYKNKYMTFEEFSKKTTHNCPSSLTNCKEV